MHRCAHAPPTSKGSVRADVVILQEPGGGVDPWDGVREIFALESTSNPTTAQSERLAIAANEARHISLILTTVYIAMLTLGCLHRTAPLYQLYKHGSFYCSAAFACVAVLQSIYQVRNTCREMRLGYLVLGLIASQPSKDQP